MAEDNRDGNEASSPTFGVEMVLDVLAMVMMSEVLPDETFGEPTAAPGTQVWTFGHGLQGTLEVFRPQVVAALKAGRVELGSVGEIVTGSQAAGRLEFA